MFIQSAPLTPSRASKPLLPGSAPRYTPSLGGLTDDDISVIISDKESCTPSILGDAHRVPAPGPLTLMDVPTTSSVSSRGLQEQRQSGSYPWSNLGDLSTDSDPAYRYYQMASRPYFLVQQGSRSECAHVMMQGVWQNNQPLRCVFPSIHIAPTSVALYYVNPFTERKEMLGYVADLFGRPAQSVLTRSLLAVPAHNGPDTDISTLTAMVLAAACFHRGVMVKRDLAVSEVLLQGILPPWRTQAFGQAFTLIQAYDLWTLRDFFKDRAELALTVESPQSLRWQASIVPIDPTLMRVLTTLSWAAQHPLEALATCLLALPRHP